MVPPHQCLPNVSSCDLCLQRNKWRRICVCVGNRGGGSSEATEDGEGKGRLSHNIPSRNQHTTQGSTSQHCHRQGKTICRCYSGFLYNNNNNNNNSFVFIDMLSDTPQ